MKIYPHASVFKAPDGTKTLIAAILVDGHPFLLPEMSDHLPLLSVAVSGTTLAKSLEGLLTSIGQDVEMAPELDRPLALSDFLARRYLK